MSEMPRREFLRRLGGGVVAMVLGGAALAPDNRSKHVCTAVCPCTSGQGVRYNAATMERPALVPEAMPPVGDFKVFYPGMTGGGRYLTAIRQEVDTIAGEGNALVVSSISSREGLRKGESSKTRSCNQAATIAEMAQGRNLNWIAHSLGILETVNTLDELISNTSWNGKEIKLHLVSPIGFGQEGLGAILDVGRGLSELNATVAGVEQHIVYPGPESYYQSLPETTSPDDVDVLFKDSPEDRAERRASFREGLRYILPDEQKRATFLTEIDGIDSRISDTLLQNQPVDELLAKRKELLAPYVQAMFRGEHLPAELHDKYLTQHHELEEYLEVPFWQQANFYLFMAQGIGNIYQGMDRVLANIINKAREKGIEITFDFIIQEKDAMVPMGKIDVLRDGVSAHQLSEAFGGFGGLKDHGHSSFGIFTKSIGSVYAH